MIMSRYKVIVFDLGNVLIPFDHTLAAKRFEAIAPGMGERYMNFFRDHYNVHRAFERGDMSRDEFISFLSGVLNYKLEPELLCRIISEIFVVNQDVADLLPVLRENYRLVLLSNTNDIHHEFGWQHYPFLRNFEKLILSHEVNAVKPEEKIYKEVQAYTQEEPSSHIFIDDIAEYAEGARRQGWDAVQFTGYDNLVKELRSRGII